MNHNQVIIDLHNTQVETMYSSKSSRRKFLAQLGLVSAAVMLVPSVTLGGLKANDTFRLLRFDPPLDGEDLFSYIKRKTGRFDLILYRQLVGAANPFKEGDQIEGIAAADEESRQAARRLIHHTYLKDVIEKPLFRDAQFELIQQTTVTDSPVLNQTFGELKAFLLQSSEDEIKRIMPSLSSDCIAFVVKLMTNEELIAISSKVFNPLPGSQIGSKGYLSARIQPNSPTDDTEDIIWQVFNGWSFAVGDLVLGTNPVSSDPQSVAQIESALFDLISTFQLEKVLPHSVLSHIDIQSKVETMQPGTTGIWFQSLAGTVEANQTFDITIEKMQSHVDARRGRYGLYAETGQGADGSNGHGEGFDMVVHESRKYGFVRALKQQFYANPHQKTDPWVFLNDVAGFIGPEVFRTKEQLVRCCLEDLVMGKLHGLTIGLDICTTLHMDVTLDDLDWCIDQIMPANPGYLMALPTKNDPMLSYLTTSFADHVRIRKKFGYKLNDEMWSFFKQLGVIGIDNQPTSRFGQPQQVYLAYRKAKGDERSDGEILEEGHTAMNRVRQRGVPIAEGFGQNYWDLQPDLDREIRDLYADAKYCLWTEFDSEFLNTIPKVHLISSLSEDKVDYVYHPATGERLTDRSIRMLNSFRDDWKESVPDIQIIISDGLNARSLMDKDHLQPFLNQLYIKLKEQRLSPGPFPISIRYGRVRAGYAAGEILFGKPASRSHGIIHLIGERPGTIHRNYSAYLTVTSGNNWNVSGKVDHDITRVVSGISDTSYHPTAAADEVARLMAELFGKA
jgi:ethanolamine ammonia-lyase large subunit